MSRSPVPDHRAHRTASRPIWPLTLLGEMKLSLWSQRVAKQMRRLKMLELLNSRPKSVIGPLGEPLTMDTLPAADTGRWVVRRKAEVVAAVHGGLLTIAEACARYDLTLEEYASWERGIERSGMLGLRATRIQFYRDQYERQSRY